MTLRVLSLYEGFFAGGARILHSDVVAGLHAGGEQSHAVLSLSAQAHRDATVQFAHDDPRYRRLAAAGVEITALGGTAGADPMHPSSFRELDLHRAADAVAQADVVLSLKEQPLGLLLALRAHGMMPSVPVAACLHRSDPTHSGPALGWLREAAETGLLTATISCARSTDEAYAQHLPFGLDRRVVPNGIDIDVFRPNADDVASAALRASLGIPLDAPVVLLAARFDAMKDPGLFLDAAARHAAARPDAHYVLCGAGMTQDNAGFASLMDAATSADRVHALGIRSDMAALYRIADIVALTSAFGEASPLCLLEGAASGATPVTTDVGDAARSVEGFGLVTPRDPDAIAAAWEAVLHDRAGYREAALAARPSLSRGRMVDEYRLAIQSLAERRRLAA
ncbi:glycosyltransferase involved in cell wall biosynthesis [Microbacterium sp. BE35]|uniref:glycosyltransferase n=1 Tax=Microbacterium sp. BE35 TaxID=2817773 RepID=UPI00285F7C55|nr:glycosyltransferase [Microbacterium sp. BE35]MDR7188783.1 glycosyltransferase involved in cell wall biosynthesis [Microbacterium sp. BE35]